MQDTLIKYVIVQPNENKKAKSVAQTSVEQFFSKYGHFEILNLENTV